MKMYNWTKEKSTIKEMDFKTTNLQEKFQAEYLKLLEKNPRSEWRQMCGGWKKEN